MCSQTLDGRSILKAVESVRAMLGRHPQLFEVTDVLRTEPMTTDALTVIERQLNIVLPDVLRDLYTSVASHVFFNWRTKAEQCEKLGYREELRFAEATLDILDPHDWLKQRPKTIVVITHDHFGNGWALDYRWGVEPTPLVWYDHTEWDGETEDPNHDSFEEMWADYVEYGFISRPTSASDLVWRYLRDGELPTPSEV
jgi:hypothetical protein